MSSESLYHPLALDTWSRVFDATEEVAVDGETQLQVVKVSSYDRAGKVAETQVKKISCEIKRELAHRGLLATIADQAARNNRYGELTSLSVEDRNFYQKAMYGEAEPATMTSLLHSFPVLESVEIARLTHVDDWNVWKKIDDPVRRSLIESKDTDSEYLPDSPYYKIKMFHEDGLMVERKRPIIQSFGGSVITVIRNNLLVDYHDPTIPAPVLEYGQSEYEKLQDRKSPEYDFKNESKFLHDSLEAHVQNRAAHEKPSWVTPLLTTYYSVLAEKRIAKNE